MENMQPTLFPACHHIGRHARAGKYGREGYAWTGEARFHESFPTPGLAKLRVVTPLASHGRQVERAALVYQLSLFRRPHLKVLQSVAHARPMLGMQRRDAVGAPAQHVETAFQSRPTHGRKPGAENPGLTYHPPQFLRFGIEHALKGQTHEKRSGDGIPKGVARPQNTPSTQLEKARQHTSG